MHQSTRPMCLWPRSKKRTYFFLFSSILGKNLRRGLQVPCSKCGGYVTITGAKKNILPLPWNKSQKNRKELPPQSLRQRSPGRLDSPWVFFDIGKASATFGHRWTEGVQSRKKTFSINFTCNHGRFKFLPSNMDKFTPINRPSKKLRDPN